MADSLDRRIALLGQFRTAALLEQIEEIDTSLTVKADERARMELSAAAARAELLEAERMAGAGVTYDGKNAEERRARAAAAIQTDPARLLAAARELDTRQMVDSYDREIAALQRKGRRLYATLNTRIAILGFLAPSVTVAEPEFIKER